MNVSKHVDWLSATFPDESGAFHLIETFDWKFTGKGRHGYKEAYADVSGAFLQTRAFNPEMGTHLTLPGSALSHIRTTSAVTDDELIRRISASSGRVSRLDSAVNLHGSSLTPQSFRDAFRAGKLATPAKKHLWVEGGEDGSSSDTFYLGGRSSERFLRVYDKNAESHIVDPVSWLRLEQECKGLYAKSIQNAMSEHGVEKVVTAQFNEFIQWDNSDFKQAMDAESAEIVELGRKDTNRQQWLLGQVAKALAREVVTDDSFLDRFMDVLFSEIGFIEDKENPLTQSQQFEALRKRYKELHGDD